MPEFLLRNVQVIDPQSAYHLQNCDIWVVDEKIVEIAPAFSLSTGNKKVIEAEGLCVSPGWIDMQVHLSDPGNEAKETLSATAIAAAKGGFTRIVGYPQTRPIADNAQVLQSLQLRSQNLPIHFHFAGTLTHQGAGKEIADLYEMHSSGAIAFTDGIFSHPNAGLNLRLRQYMQPFEGLMLCYPSEKTLVADGQMNEGKSAVQMGMKGIPEMAESLAVTSELYLYGYAPTRTHFQPISSPEALKVLTEAKKKYDKISVGTAVMYIALNDEALKSYDTHFKVYPPLRAQHQAEQIIAYIQKGTIDVLTSAHFPQGLEEKETEFEVAEHGMLGLQTAFSLANEVLVQSGKIDLTHLIRLFSQNPRSILKLPPISIEKQQTAELTLFIPTEKWVLSAANIPSTAKNTPFLHQTLTGFVWGIVCKGAFLGHHADLRR